MSTFRLLYDSIDAFLGESIEEIILELSNVETKFQQFSCSTRKTHVS